MEENSRTCVRCDTERILTDFYLCPSGNRKMICRFCDMARIKAWNKTNNNKRKKYLEKFNASDGKKIINKKWRKSNKEKSIAHLRVHRRKISIRPGFEFHHWSYKPEHTFDVIELPTKIHRILHSKMKYDKTEMMYRDCFGNLLDSKESHLEILRRL